MSAACSGGVFQIESSYECRRKRTASTIFTSLVRQSTAAIVAMTTNQSRLRHVATELHSSTELFVRLTIRSRSCKPDVPHLNGVNVFLLSLLSQHVMPSVSTRNLGVIFYNMYFREHISQRFVERVIITFVIYPVFVVFSPFFCKTIATALVTSRLDYCNSRYQGFQKKLQRVQNCLASVVTCD